MMKMLALEQSTDRYSAAFLENGNVLKEEILDCDKPRKQEMFAMISSVVPDLSALDAVTVGLGPGSFSGLRMALTAARTVVLPGNGLVYGIVSPLVLAWKYFRDEEPATVCVLGDARRKKLWSTVLRVEGKVTVLKELVLSDPEEIPKILDSCDFAISSDWDRLDGMLGKIQTSCHMISGNRYPSASSLGLMTFHEIAPVVHSPVSPVYMHPAVFIPPK